MTPRVSLSRPLLLALSGLNLLLIALYARETGMVPTPQAWVASFGWEPATVPFSAASFARRLADGGRQGVVFAGWLGVAAWLGNRLLRRWFPEAARDGGEEAILSAGIGLGALALAATALAAAGLLRPVAIGLAGLGALVALALTGSAADVSGRATGAAAACRDTVTGRLRTALRGDEVFFVPALALCVASLALHVPGILAPPIAFDEMSYQLALPRLYLANHGFVNTPFNHLSYLPQNVNMLFAIGLATGGLVAAKLFSLTLGVLAACAVFVFGRRWVGGKAALAAAAFFALTPVVGNQFRLAITDLGAGFYEFTGLLLLVRWLQEPGRSRTLLLSSVFWGLALGTKYTAIPGYAIALSLIVGAHLSRREWSRVPGSVGRFALPALLLWSPWLAKDWWYTGNPVAPLLSTVVPSRNFMFAGVYSPLVDYAAGLGIPQYFQVGSVSELVGLPWALATRHHDFNHDLGPMHLLVLVLLPLALGRLVRTRRLLLGLAALYWLAWLFTGVRMTRYFTAGLAVSSLLGGSVLAAVVARERRWLRMVVLLPFLIVLAVQGARIAAYQNRVKMPWGYVAGRCSEYEYLDRMIRPDSPMRAYRFINETLPPDATVLVAHEFRTLYLERRFLASTPWDHDHWHEFVRLSRDAGDLVRRLEERGVTHVFFNTRYLEDKTGKPFLADWRQEDLDKSRRFLLEGFETVFFEDGLWVGRVKRA